MATSQIVKHYLQLGNSTANLLGDIITSNARVTELDTSWGRVSQETTFYQVKMDEIFYRISYVILK